MAFQEGNAPITQNVEENILVANLGSPIVAAEPIQPVSALQAVEERVDVVVEDVQPTEPVTDALTQMDKSIVVVKGSTQIHDSTLCGQPSAAKPVIKSDYLVLAPEQSTTALDESALVVDTSFQCLPEPLHGIVLMRIPVGLVHAVERPVEDVEELAQITESTPPTGSAPEREEDASIQTLDKLSPSLNNEERLNTTGAIQQATGSVKTGENTSAVNGEPDDKDAIPHSAQQVAVTHGIPSGSLDVKVG